MPTIQEIIEEIKRLEKELVAQIQEKEQEFYYKIRGKRVYFEEATKKYHKTLVTHVHTYIFNAQFLNILTVPIIWSCLIPALFLDLFASIYQAICFRVYKIPRVDRTKYIIIDRHSLKYLNLIEKINCVYCGYFNGLMSFVQEIAARTEQYWCPIKHARRVGNIHSRYQKFFEYGDADSYRKKLQEIRKDFGDLT